jgi:hypothetical protein
MNKLVRALERHDNTSAVAARAQAVAQVIAATLTP